MVNTLNKTKFWLLGLAFLFASILPGTSNAAEAMHLIDRLQMAQVGDYIVTAIDNTYTVLIVKEKFDHQMSIEEITIPAGRLHDPRFPWCGWRKWVESGAKGHTSWVMYTIHCSSGQMREYYSYTKNSWCDMSTVDNFLSKLLSLRMVRIPKKDIRRVGPPPPQGSPDSRRTWAPQMIFEGQVCYDVEFVAWRTRWPRDCTEMSGKTITVYVPKDEKKWPSYFPYWLEIQGMLGKAKIRIIDSGRNLESPRRPPSREIH